MPLFLAALRTVAHVLDESAQLLADPRQGLTALRDTLHQLDDDVRAFEQAFAHRLPTELAGRRGVNFLRIEIGGRLVYCTIQMRLEPQTRR